MSTTKRPPPQHYPSHNHPHKLSAMLPSPPKRPRTDPQPAEQPCPISDCFDLSLKLYVSGLYVHGLLYQFTHSLVSCLRSKGAVVLPLDPQLAHHFVRTFLRCEWERGKVPLLLNAHWPPSPLSVQGRGQEPGKGLFAAERTLMSCQDESAGENQLSSTAPGPGPRSPAVGVVNAECSKLVDKSDEKDQSVTAFRLGLVSCGDKSTQTEDSDIKAYNKNVCVLCGQSRENRPLTMMSEKDLGLSQFVPDTTAEMKLAHGLEKSLAESIAEDTKLEEAHKGHWDMPEKSGDAYVKPDTNVPRYGRDVIIAQTVTINTQTRGYKKKTQYRNRSNLIQLTGNNYAQASHSQTDHHATLDIQTGNVQRPGESQTTNGSGHKDTEPLDNITTGHVDIIRQVPVRINSVPISEHENSLQNGGDSVHAVASQAGQDAAHALGGVPPDTLRDADFQDKQADNGICLPALTNATIDQSISLSAGGNQLQSNQQFGMQMKYVMRERSPIGSQYISGSNLQRFVHFPRASPSIAGRFVYQDPQRFRNPFGGQNQQRFLRTGPNGQSGLELNEDLHNCEKMGPGQQNVPSLQTSWQPVESVRLGSGNLPTLIHPLISDPQNNARLAEAVYSTLRCPRPGGGHPLISSLQNNPSLVGAAQNNLRYPRPGESQQTQIMLGPFPQRPGGNHAQRVCIVPPSLGRNCTAMQSMIVPTHPPPCYQPAMPDHQPALCSEAPLTAPQLAGRHAEDICHLTGLHMEHAANIPTVSAPLVNASGDALGANQDSYPAPTRGLSHMQDAGLYTGDIPITINNQTGVVISMPPQCSGTTTQGYVQADSAYGPDTHGEHRAGGSEWNTHGFSESCVTVGSMQTPVWTGIGIVAQDKMSNRTAWTGIIRPSHSAAKHLTHASPQNDYEPNPVFHSGINEGQQRNVTGDDCIASDQTLPFAGTAMCVGEQDRGSKSLKADRPAGRVTDDLATVTSVDGDRACILSGDSQGVERDPFQDQSSTCAPSESTTSHAAFDNHLSSKFHRTQLSVPFHPSLADCCQSTETYEKHADSHMFTDSIGRHADTMSFDRSGKHAKQELHKQRPTNCQQSFDSSAGHTDNFSSMETHSGHKQSSDSSGGHTDNERRSEKQTSQIRETESDAEARLELSHKKDEPQTTTGQIQKIVGQIQLIVGQLYGDKNIKSLQAPASTSLSRLSADRTRPDQVTEKAESSKSSSIQTSTSSYVKTTNRLVTAEKTRPLSTKKASVQTQHTSTPDKRHQGIVTDTPDTRTRWTMTIPPVRVNRRMMTDLLPMSDAASWTERVDSREASTETDSWPTKDRWTLTRCHRSVIARACQAALPEQQHVQTYTEPSPPCVKAEQATMTHSTYRQQATMTEEALCSHQRKQSQWAETQTDVRGGVVSEDRVAVRDREGSGGTEGTVKITIRLRMGRACQASLLGTQ